MEGCSAARAQRRRPPQARRWRGRAPGRWATFRVAGCVCGSWWGCATRGRRGGRRVVVPRLPPTVAGGWRRSRSRVRSLSLSSSSGRNGSLVALGASAATSCRHSRPVRVSVAASRFCRVAVGRFGRPGRVGVARRSLGSTWVPALSTCMSAINPAGTGRRWAAQATDAAAGLRRTWSASSVTSCDRAFR